MYSTALVEFLLLLLAFAGPGAMSANAQKDKETNRNPHGLINMPCENCHTNSGWKPIRGVPEFDHNRTSYPLRGMHQQVACTQCHTNLVFTHIGTRCADCHADLHRGQFGAKCEECHTVQGWEVRTQHLKDHWNRFPLLGAHAMVDCVDCHKNEAVGQFTGLSTACYSCHTSDFQNATGPNHKTLNFPVTCESCHTADTWFGAKFDHLKYTGYALTGAHATLDCTACHINGKFAGTPADCYSCHLKDYTGSTNPNHVKAGIPTLCSTCHNTTAWIPASFDHNLTSFPLTGAHVTVLCATCHTDNYAGTLPTNCYGCHAKDFNNTATIGGSVPNHVNGGFSQNCTLCHTTQTWLNATFDHSLTAFPLTGAHVTVACATCHTDNYAGTLPTNCYGCHAKDFNNTATIGGSVPNHVNGGFSQNCTLCHTTQTWLNATFDHSLTAFPLTGAHVTVACATCHTDNYAGTLPTTCYGCHTKDYNNTATIAGVPNHVTANFPQDCTLCHSTSTWLNATFNHNNTSFPLTGAHVTVACATCHTDNYAGTLPTNCYGCHTKDYNNTATISGVPNHVTAAYPTDCTICHNTTSWLGAVFNHNNTPFPLTGAHVTVPCASCHIGGVYAGTPTDCYSCHKADYAGTTNPNHTAAGFPTTCDTCHTTTSWLGATFNHTWWPITHGGAKTCSDCHTNPSNYAVFTCTTCHTQAQTNSDHQGVSGYVYNSINCYSCHKN